MEYNEELQEFRLICDECDVDFFMPEENITLENQVLGGFDVNETEPWIVTTYDLDYAGDVVEFRVVHAPLPRCIGDFNESAEAAKFYESRRSYLIPRFKN